MLVQEIMTQDVITVKPTDKLKIVASLLFKQNLTGVPVVDDSSKVIGIVTEYDFINPDLELHIPTYIDFLQALEMVKTKESAEYQNQVSALSEATVENIMTTDVITVEPTTDIKEVVKIITSYRINPIPVVDSHGQLKGIVSRADLLKVI